MLDIFFFFFFPLLIIDGSILLFLVHTVPLNWNEVSCCMQTVLMLYKDVVRDAEVKSHFM